MISDNMMMLYLAINSIITVFNFIMVWVIIRNIDLEFAQERGDVQ